MCLYLVSEQMRVFIHRKCWSSTFLQNPNYISLNADDAGRMLIGWQVGWKMGSEQQQSSQEMEEAWKKSINVQYENYRLWLQWTLHCLTLSFTSALWMLEVRSPVPLADGPAEVQARVTHRPVEPHILCTGSINNKHSVGWLTFVNDSNTIKTLFNACSCHISLVYTSFWCFRAVHSNMWPQYITCLMVS